MLASVVLVAGCGSDESSTPTTTAPRPIDYQSVATRIDAEALDDSARDCVFDVDAIIDAVAGSLPVADAYDDEGVENFLYATPDIGPFPVLYCNLHPENNGDGKPGEIDRLRVVLSTSAAADPAEYLGFHVSTGGQELVFADEEPLLEGSVTSTCLDDGSFCAAFWQGDGLWAAVVLFASEDDAFTGGAAAQVLGIVLPLALADLS